MGCGDAGGCGSYGKDEVSRRELLAMKLLMHEGTHSVLDLVLIIVPKPLQSAFFLDVERCSLDGM